MSSQPSSPTRILAMSQAEDGNWDAISIDRSLEFC